MRWWCVLKCYVIVLYLASWGKKFLMQLDCQLWQSGIENFNKWFKCLVSWPLICTHENLLMSGYVQWMILLSTDIKIYWKKLILLIFFFEVSKINLFWYTWIFSHCQDIFCYFTGFFFNFFFYNNLSKYWIKVNFCLGCWSGLIAWVFVIIQALYNNKMLFWVQCSPNLSYQRSSKRISYVL